MVPRIKTSPLISILFICLLSSGMILGLSNGKGSPTYALHKNCVKTDSRKLLSHDAVLDYDDPGPNHRHDPRGRRGGGGRNP